jgi:hypothetical protein
MKHLRKWAWLLPIVGLLAIAWIAVLSSELPYGTPFTGSIRDTGTGGGAALARWLPRVGFHFVTLSDAWPKALDRIEPKTGNCLLSLGDDWNRSEALAEADWSGLRRWIELGNSFVVATSAPSYLPKAFFEQLLGIDRGALKEVGPVGLEQERESVEIPHAAAKLTVHARVTHWKGVPATWEVAGDEKGSVYLRITVGKGAVVILLDDLAFSNDGLDAGENPNAIRSILEREVRAGVLALDEARHHSGRAGSYLTALASLPGARFTLWYGALLLAFFVLAANVRLGPPLPFQLPERRSAREYVEAMAGIYERARGAPLMVEAVAARTAQLARRRGLGEQPAIAAGCARAARYAGGGEREKVPTEAMEIIAELLSARREALGAQRSEG